MDRREVASFLATVSAVTIIAPQLRCRVCATPLAGPYCQECGQPSTAARRTLREVLAGQNGRLLHTLRIILTAPGELAREIDEGRDRLSMRPLTLLFHLAAFFFLVSTFTGFGIDVITRADRSGALAAMVARNADRFPAALYHERLEHRFQAIYTLFVPLIALGYGGTIGLLHWRCKPWMVPLAAGIQYLCFVYIFVAVLWALARAFGAEPFALSPIHPVVALLALGYATLTQQRVYGERVVPAALKSVVVVVVGALVHNLAMLAAFLVAIEVT